jgi:hypothetical protein
VWCEMAVAFGELTRPLFGGIVVSRGPGGRVTGAWRLGEMRSLVRLRAGRMPGRMANWGTHG